MSGIFDREARYVTSYLFSPMVLGTIRLLFGVYTITTNLVILIWSGVVSDEAQQYFSFFTHLSYIGVSAWFCASSVQSIAFAKACRTEGRHNYPLQSWPRVFQILHEILYSTIATFPFLVTIVYWGLLASSDSFSDSFTTWSTVSQHIINSIFVLFEIFLTDLPTLRWIHLAVTIVMLGLYLGVAYITHETQGFYAYTFLDPKEKGAALAGYIIGIAVGQAIIFIIVRYAIILKIRLVGRKSIQQHSSNSSNEEKEAP